MNMNTIDILSAIAGQHPDIQAFSFITFPRQTYVQDAIREWGGHEERMFQFAMEMRERYALPFWNGIMLSTFGRPDYSPQLLQAALHHNPITRTIRIEAQAVKEKRIEEHLEAGERHAVNSEVCMADGTLRHLPMFDFHIPVANENVAVVKDVCHIMGLPEGYLLNSGASYHYIGNGTVTTEALERLLISALHFCPIIDGAWLCHQLQEHSCSLRIDRKNGQEATLICRV